MTVLSQIADAIIAALNAPAKPAGVPVAHLWSGIQLESTDLPARFLVWTEESVSRGSNPYSPLVKRTVTFVLQDLAAGTGSAGSTPQQVAEAFRAWSVKALAMNTLGGLAIDIVEQRCTWEVEQGDEPFVRMTHEFEVSYTTKTVDAESRA